MTSLKRHNPRIDMRPSVSGDIDLLNLKSSEIATFRGITFLVDGVPSAIGGVEYHNGIFIAFCNIKEDIKVSKATVFRCGLEVMKMIKSMGVAPVAIRESRFPNSDRFLRALGFEPYMTHDGQECYVCRH